MEFRTKEEQVADYLREGIIAGRFPRGTRLKQQQIADMLSTSITPVREALKLLEAEGYVSGDNYRGAIVGKQRDTNGSTFVAGVINIEALRHHRQSAQMTNWPKDIRAELAQIIYEQPIYPKNLYVDKIPGRHAEYKREVIEQQVRLMQERGIWKPPASG